MADTTPTLSNYLNYSNHYFDELNFTESSLSSSGGGSNSRADLVRRIHLIVRPLLVFLGTIGNLLAFYIMQRGSLKKVSTCFYMAILALADTGMLWSGAFVAWIRYLAEVDTWLWTDCKVGIFLLSFCRHYSSAILSIMSVEKFLALYFPLKTKAICTVTVARRVSVVSALVFVVFNLYLFFTYDNVTDANGNSRCQWVGNAELVETFYNRATSMIYSFIPFAIMILANAAIIFKMMMARWRSKRSSTIGPNSETSNQALSKSATRGTVMLVTVSITFIILTGPIAVMYYSTNRPDLLLLAVVTMLQYLNHSINAVLYCIVGSKFRRELLKTFSCGKNKIESSTLTGTTSNVTGAA